MLHCNLSDLKNESDVEQKLIVPLITENPPKGLGYLNSDYYSKSNLNKISIGKGSEQKLYRPDFIAYIDGVPVLVIEAKHPNESAETGYREARLYASEINAQFQTGINPCAKIFSSNGHEIWYGNTDELKPRGVLRFDEINILNENFDKFLDFCSKDKISQELSSILKKVRSGKQFHKPVAILGGSASREEILGENLFGISLMTEHHRIFNPKTYSDRVDIVKNAYIPSRAIEKNTDPIRKIILAATPPSIVNTTKIEDTSKPKELLERLFGKKRLTNQLLLLVGNVGSGKSTFIDYLREVALPESVKKQTVWVYLNLNNAQFSDEGIYEWLQEQIIEQMKELHSEKNLDNIDELLKLYSKEIKSFNDGEGSLLKADEKEYNKALATLISDLKKDKAKTAKCYTKYLCGETGKTFILVLDNCDKRNKNDQLKIFDVAQWAKEEYQSLVFLPLRDTTYDLHRTEPPLDTVVKDMTFRIEPPKLSDVLYRRVSYAISQLDGELEYTLTNGMTVKVNKKEQEEYLKCMLESLYNSTPLAKKIIDGLSGRDVRRGIEIFIEFCKSGHISPEQILKVRVSKGVHTIESHIVMRALLRGNKRFYSDKNSYVKNLFQSYPDEENIPDPFIRIDILDWFEKRKGTKGPSNIKGYHKVSALLSDLQMVGHSEKRILSELSTLLRERCLLSEAQIEENLAEIKEERLRETIASDDLVRIASAGAMHLELLTNITYLAACAEDVWYEDQAVAQLLANRITKKVGVGQFSFSTTLFNSRDLVNYLVNYRKKYFIDESLFSKDGFDGFQLESVKDSVNEDEKRFTNRNVHLQKMFPVGTEVNGIVDSHKNLGIVVRLDPSTKGLVSSFDLKSQTRFNPGMPVKVKITGFDELRSKFNLILCEDVV